MDERFSNIDKRFINLEKSIDERFTQVDRRFDELKEYVDTRFQEFSQRFDKLESNLKWAFGLVAGLFVPLIAGILAIIIKIFFGKLSP